MRAWISTRIGQAEVDRTWLLDTIRSFLRVRQSINWRGFLGREKITDTFRTLFHSFTFNITDIAFFRIGTVRNLF